MTSLEQKEAKDLKVGDIIASYWHDERWHPAVILAVRGTEACRKQIDLSGVPCARPQPSFLSALYDVAFEDRYRTVVPRVSCDEIHTGKLGRKLVCNVGLEKPPTYSLLVEAPGEGDVTTACSHLAS